MSWRGPGGAKRKVAAARRATGCATGKQIDFNELASDLVDVFMPAVPGILLFCMAGLLAMIGLWAGTGYLLGKHQVGLVKVPVALFRIAFGGQRRSGRPDGRVGGR